jgi:DNA-binding NtrC family response regulator
MPLDQQGVTTTRHRNAQGLCGDRAEQQRQREVLVVDDEAGIRSALLAHFSREGWRVSLASGVREAEMRLAQTEYDLVVSDVRMADGSGVELLRALRADDGRTPVVLQTAFGTVAEAVEAMRFGAADYLTKPVAWKELQGIVKRLEQEAHESEANRHTTPKPTLSVPATASNHATTTVAVKGPIGHAPMLLRGVARARAAATTDAAVLIEAESGAGKQRLARYIHALSSRAARRLITVACCGRDEGTLAHELFGEVGALAQADGGALLLRDVDCLPARLQSELLCVLEAGELMVPGRQPRVVNLRMMATTRSSLESAVERGGFAVDLYYRLNVIPLALPPLRERLEDIPALVGDCWAELRALSPFPSANLPAARVSAEFLDRLARQPWPGNVRELKGFLQIALELQGSAPGDAGVLDGATFARVEALLESRSLGTVERGETGWAAKESGGENSFTGRGAGAAEARGQFERLGPSVQKEGPEMPGQGQRSEQKGVLPAGLPIRQLERLHLEKTLELTQGNRTHAAEMLGISLRTMRNRIREYGLPPRRYA